MSDRPVIDAPAHQAHQLHQAPQAHQVHQAPPTLAVWRTLLDALGEPAWLVGARDRLVLAINAEALGLLGLAEAAVLGRGADTLIATPEDMAFWD